MGKLTPQDDRPTFGELAPCYSSHSSRRLENLARAAPGSLAWDVYLVYPPGVEWNGRTPPRPGYFMHQLNQLPANRYLDGDTLAARVRGMLSSRDQ
jgi:hypothetical protein